MKKIVLVIGIACMIASCSEDKDDLVIEVPKDGSIETSVVVQHLNDSQDLLVTAHLVNKNFETREAIVHKDTIPALGTTVVIDATNKGQMVQKDYDIFITIK